MKVLLVNGSSRENGCTFTALDIVAKQLQENGIDTEFFHIGNVEVRDCAGCGACRKTNSLCVYNDDGVNDFINKAKDFDGFVFGSPVYYAHPSGRLISFMDRVFYAGGASFKYKPAAAIVSARRAGTTAALDVITKHFVINSMPLVSSNYWHMVHGNNPEEVLQDSEGLQIMRVLGNNMAWILKCIEAGKQNGIAIPVQEEKIKTNFVR